ncbi:High-affinity nicotinic acid transporter [Cyphellophora attinorum]|uniref:High-affinity nicotinic acid transporter n=1 Tax=Cyphellophora attinorum TaxID=1664694 RepID=A0A0N1HIG3_9EURO|nr:High-affinity nicotinic acid transporter [Phialophora attinorum]KPI35872.1 High-affinity nicotinic acid transporter [Phialophora attinorum]
MATTSPIEEKPRSVLSEKDVSGVEVERSRTEHQEIVQRYEDSKARKRVLRKIDIRLIPIMGILYLISHIDRANIGNAKIEGMDKDLGLVGNQYNIASTIFFVPYIIFEIPSNMVLKKVRPSIWLPLLVVCWGTVMTCMGVVKNFRELIACRVLLGTFEAGFFPGAVFLVSCWYKRSELQQRLALFYTASAFSGAFSGLLAFAIAKMDGARGIEGWRWIFLIEGAVTVATGLVVPFLITDSPESASWLSDDEKAFINARLTIDGVIATTEEGDKFSWKLFFAAVLDPKVWAGIVMAWANSVPNAAFKFTMPQIIKGLGFTSSNAQLLTIPPYFCGGMAAWISGRLADRFKWRFPFIAGPLTLLMISLAVLFGLATKVKDNVGALYFAIILAQVGTYPILPCISAWTGNNLAPSWKRSIGLAWTLAAGNIGSLVGTNIFLDKEAPRYQTGYGTALGFICLGLGVACALEVCLKIGNKRKESMSEDEVRQKYTDAELDKMGDKSPLFRYIL